MLTSAQIGRSRAVTLRLVVNHDPRVPALTLDGLRQIATEMPFTLPAAALCARRFYPRSGLGRHG